MTKYYHVDIWGSREDKYSYLNENDWTTIEWKEIFPTSPFYLFIPQNKDLLAEYNQGWKITDIMPVNSVGIVTARDSLTIKWSQQEVKNTVKDFASLPVEEARKKYDLGKDTRDWQVKLAQNDLNKYGIEDTNIVPILYRPFDTRFTYYTGQTKGFICMPRFEVMRHILGKKNLVLITARGIEVQREYDQIFCTTEIIQNHSLCLKEANYLFPLYIYPDIENAQYNLFTERTSNFSPSFLSEIKAKLGYIPTPEAIFYYAYAIFHSPTYRQLYSEFLKIDFPRLPLTSNEKLFKNLAQKGEELVQLHLMESQQLNRLITKYQGEGENNVTEVTYKPQQQRIYINKTRYFEGIPPEIWEFKIGGYQVLDKWLKDRKKANRSLSFDDILHYQKIVVALTATLNIMKEIDQIIPEWPIQ
ncbi:type ISP restriction/modification enzyme [Planktothrix mougeotii]|uniref:Helicase n=1 Tax=Planktothrix mougeotii LEGE 06226 TaxID=1828728 RepID=A0ABR9U6G5_9CYAN|nr:type ISP restriction/modification enzyme [Planktothrix mougeotii]MBE9142044.1 helicase [Planktothrix mougeotii LEGE 06226]